MSNTYITLQRSNNPEQRSTIEIRIGDEMIYNALIPILENDIKEFENMSDAIFTYINRAKTKGYEMKKEEYYAE